MLTFGCLSDVHTEARARTHTRAHTHNHHTVTHKLSLVTVCNNCFIYSEPLRENQNVKHESQKDWETKVRCRLHFSRNICTVPLKKSGMHYSHFKILQLHITHFPHTSFFVTNPSESISSQWKRSFFTLEKPIM